MVGDGIVARWRISEYLDAYFVSFIFFAVAYMELGVGDEVQKWDFDKR